jgi:hypothetical protein
VRLCHLVLYSLFASGGECHFRRHNGHESFLFSNTRKSIIGGRHRNLTVLSADGSGLSFLVANRISSTVPLLLFVMPASTDKCIRTVAFISTCCHSKFLCRLLIFPIFRPYLRSPGLLSLMAGLRVFFGIFYRFSISNNQNHFVP